VATLLGSERAEIVDWFHASEYVWSVAKELHARGEPVRSAGGFNRDAPNTIQMPGSARHIVSPDASGANDLNPRVQRRTRSHTMECRSRSLS